MRNWNDSAKTSSAIFSFGFYSTYEELKLLLQFLQAASFPMFLQYLWGIETILLKSFYSVIPLFLQYLWGIETDEWLINRDRINEFLQYLWGIETIGKYVNNRITRQFTVPEVKLCTVVEAMIPTSGFLQYLWGIETRTWYLVTEDGKQFLQYLWGIETSVWEHLRRGYWLFLQYLWGIETLHKQNLFSNTEQVFTVPMRNWNPQIVALLQISALVFTVPMRNWN